MTSRKMQYDTITSGVIMDGSRTVDIGVDMRSIPTDSPWDRVCAECGDSISVDGVCEHCDEEQSDHFPHTPA